MSAEKISDTSSISLHSSEIGVISTEESNKKLRSPRTPRSNSLPAVLLHTKLSLDEELELDDEQFEQMQMLDAHENSPNFDGEELTHHSPAETESDRESGILEAHSAPNRLMGVVTTPIPRYKKLSSLVLETTQEEEEDAYQFNGFGEKELQTKVLEMLKNETYRMGDKEKSEKTLFDPKIADTNGNIEEKQSSLMDSSPSQGEKNRAPLLSFIKLPTSPIKTKPSEIDSRKSSANEKTETKVVEKIQTSERWKKKNSQSFVFNHDLKIPDSESESESSDSAMNSTTSAHTGPFPSMTSPLPLSTTNKSRTKKSHSMLSFAKNVHDKHYKSPYLMRKLTEHLNKEEILTSRALLGSVSRKISSSSDHSNDRASKIAKTTIPVHASEVQSPKTNIPQTPSAKLSPTNLLDSSGRFTIPREQSQYDEHIEEMMLKNKHITAANDFLERCASLELKEDPAGGGLLKAKAVMCGLLITMVFSVYQLLFHSEIRNSWFGRNALVLSFLFSWILFYYLRFCSVQQLFYVSNYAVGVFVFANACSNYILGGKGRLSMTWLCLAPPLSLLSSGLIPSLFWNGVLVIHSYSLYLLWAIAPWIFVQDEFARISNYTLLIQNPLLYATSTLVAFLFWSSNLSYVLSLEKANVALEAARDEAITAVKLKAEFLACMSHEIRTPLNGIIGMLQLALSIVDAKSPIETPSKGSLSRTPKRRNILMSKEQEDYLHTAYSSAENLLSLLNDILDFSKIEAQQMKFDKIEFSLRQSLEDCMKVFAVVSHQKGLELICDVDPLLSDNVTGDPNRLRQIISNLVGNAVKFTGSGGEIVVLVEQNRTDLDFVHFIVKDNGVGIPKDKITRIFQPYQQEDGGATSRKYGGTGLGLVVCSKLVELYGGKIWVESDVGKGSQFHFTARLFPHLCEPKPMSAILETSKSDLAPRKLTKRVLLITEQESLRKSIFRMGSRISSMHDDFLFSFDHLSPPESLESVLSTVKQRRANILIIDSGQLKFSSEELLQASSIASNHVVDGIIRLCWSTELISISEANFQRRRNFVLLMKPVIERELATAFDQILRFDGTESFPRTVSGTGQSFVFGDGSGDLSASVGQNQTPMGFNENLTVYKVLLVDDNAINLKVASSMIQKLGHKPICLQSGEAALKYLDECRFQVDCIFMDIQMEQMDGIETTARIREMEARLSNHQRIPIVALTANAAPGDNEQYLRQGMDLFLTKPIRIPELVKCLDNITTAVNSRNSGKVST